MRSTFNVGSLLRTAEGLGVSKVFLTGYTPYPKKPDDERLPHISQKLDSQIKKTALGAEAMIDWEYKENIYDVFAMLEQQEIEIIALEQTPSAVPIQEFHPMDKTAIVLGTEVTGIPEQILRVIPAHVVLPMFGKKESFNVIQAAAMALYDLRFR